MWHSMKTICVVVELVECRWAAAVEHVAGSGNHLEVRIVDDGDVCHLEVGVDGDGDGPLCVYVCLSSFDDLLFENATRRRRKNPVYI